MKKRLKSKAFLVPLIFGALIAAAGCALSISRGFGVLSALCDGCFISGVLIMGFSGLCFVSKQGVFDIFSFGISHVFTIRWPGLSPMQDDHRKEKYADYKVRKQGERKAPLETLLAGSFYMVLAGILLAIYLLV